MNRKKCEKPPVPTDEEILAYDDVPVSVAARYLGWTENNVRLALREGRAMFGTAVRDKAISHKISPGGLVRYKREGAPCMDYETMKFMLREVVRDVMREELEEAVGVSIRATLQEEFALLLENIEQTFEQVVKRLFKRLAA